MSFRIGAERGIRTPASDDSGFQVHRTTGLCDLCNGLSTYDMLSSLLQKLLQELFLEFVMTTCVDEYSSQRNTYNG